MSKLDALIYVAWDETGEYAASTEAEDAAEALEAKSEGRFRRVVALRLTLPPAGPISASLDVSDEAAGPVVRAV